MSTTQLDADALNTLTAEERAAIEDTEYTPEELASMRSVAGDDDGENDDGEDDDSPVAVVEAKPAAAPEAANPEAPEEKPAAEAGAGDDGEDNPDFSPSYQAALPADYSDQMASLKAEKQALKDQFKSGDLDFEEYSEKLESLTERGDALAEIRLKASISEDMSSQTAEQRWQFSIDQFAKRAAKEDGIDYRKDPEKQADLDLFVKALANNPNNSKRDYDWFLTEAHKRVKSHYGIGTTSAEKAPDKTVPLTRKSPVDSAPKTLAHVPGSDGVGDLGGEFSDLDALEGFDLEQALAKMTPAQRDRFAQGA